MDNPQKLATWGTQDTIIRKQTQIITWTLLQTTVSRDEPNKVDVYHIFKYFNVCLPFPVLNLFPESISPVYVEVLPENKQRKL